MKSATFIYGVDSYHESFQFAFGWFNLQVQSNSLKYPPEIPPQKGDECVSQTKTVTRLIDGKLILQGAEEGCKFEDEAIDGTMSIDEEDDRMIFSVSREKVAFIVFGGCTLH